jgi:hypothetical protein
MELVMMAPELIRGLWGFFCELSVKALKATPLGSCPTYSCIYDCNILNILIRLMTAQREHFEQNTLSIPISSAHNAYCRGLPHDWIENPTSKFPKLNVFKN